ncbi:hypothetical protein Micbo1qcDRAFT_174865 [Microdochium bolleyi]|uniref:Uncharacterized protein n=1 Tax=Microdochium bolleyi TaxID=196109 RepID=A0A136J408_9PEZI|nr:hypothetical protein Micbo1qcDRAFT_174865 [Microdochium bolleyi]
MGRRGRGVEAAGREWYRASGRWYSSQAGTRLRGLEVVPAAKEGRERVVGQPAASCAPRAAEAQMRGTLDTSSSAQLAQDEEVPLVGAGVVAGVVASTPGAVLQYMVPTVSSPGPCASLAGRPWFRAVAAARAGENRAKITHAPCHSNLRCEPAGHSPLLLAHEAWLRASSPA